MAALNRRPREDTALALQEFGPSGAQARPDLPKDELLSIRQVADRFELSLRTLRFWEDEGLVEVTRAGHHRKFSASQVARIAQVSLWSQAGLSLNDIRALISMVEKGEPTDVFLSVRLPALRQEALERLAAIDAIMPKASKGDSAAGKPALVRRVTKAEA